MDADTAQLPGTQPPEKNASLEHEWLNGLIGSLADGVLAVDEHGKVVFYNGAVLNLLDQNSTIAGKPLGKILKLYDKEGQPVDVKAAVEGAKIPTSSRDYLLHYSDGSTANLYLSIAPVYLGYGATGGRGFVLLLRDISREKSLEEERDEFISVVSHELRTPIAITEGNISNAQLIAQKSGDIQEIRQALDAAYDQVIFLSGLVNDLSTLSRAERGRLEMTVEAIDPARLVNELVNTYRDQAAAKGLKLTAHLEPQLKTLYSGSLYVREILQNFVTNAIKYTETGHITVSAHAAVDGMQFSVADTGIGMSRSDQQKIFNKFFRSEDYRTKATTGTGLGLYITKKLTDLLHAEITTASNLNHGSTFTLTVPNLPADSPKQQTH